MIAARRAQIIRWFFIDPAARVRHYDEPLIDWFGASS